MRKRPAPAWWLAVILLVAAGCAAHTPAPPADAPAAVAAYDPATGFFYDVRWRTGERVTDRPTMAAAAPLYFRLATPQTGPHGGGEYPTQDGFGWTNGVTLATEARQHDPQGW